MNNDRYKHKSDNELLDGYYAAFDNELLGALLQRYTLLLLGVSMKYLKNEELAKDAVQQIFLQVIKELPKQRIIYFKSWLYMVAKNHCLMSLRAKGIKQYSEIKDDHLNGEMNTAADARQKEQLLQLTELSLPELNEEQKICITLFYLEKKSYLQVSNETGYTMLQVKSFIQNGKRNLKKIIEKKMKKLNG